MSPLLPSSTRYEKKILIDLKDFYPKQRLCMKKKVLLLGLDAVGKTDLFTRLISPKKIINPLPQPTIGLFSKSNFQSNLLLLLRIQRRNNQTILSSFFSSSITSDYSMGLWWTIITSFIMVVSFSQYFAYFMVN